jgi:hypothetical protein
MKKETTTVRMTTEKSIDAFMQIGDRNMISGLQAASRAKFPKTVEAFDNLTASDMEAIRFKGVKGLPPTKLDEITKAMREDEFSILLSD